MQGLKTHQIVYQIGDNEKYRQTGSLFVNSLHTKKEHKFSEWITDFSKLNEEIGLKTALD